MAVVLRRAGKRILRGLAGRRHAESDASPVASDDAGGEQPVVHSILDSYTDAAPSAQQAVDIFAGEWSSRLPDQLGVESGWVGLFDDPRIEELLAWLGDVEGIRVLELGPLEGGHTYMLDRAGAVVDAVESNSRAYLKCLVVKELLGIQRARFLRGDFVAYLKETDEQYDLVLASGVLYHMVDPIEFLELVTAASRRIALWTHYFDEDVLANSPTAQHFSASAEPVTVGDRTYMLHPREYLHALTSDGFGGGPRAYSRWMEREDILDELRRLGFGKLEITHETVDHMNGPAFLVLAERTD